MMFNVFINDRDDMGWSTLSASLWMILDWEVEGSMADTLEGRAAIQRDLDRLEKGVDSSLSKKKSESCSCSTRTG